MVLIALFQHICHGELRGYWCICLLFRVPLALRLRVPFARIEKTLGNARRTVLGNIPHTLDELHDRFINDPVIAERFSVDGQQFYQIIVGPPGERSCIFITRRGLEILNECDEFAVDSTFRCRPDTPFSRQLMMIIGYKFGYVSICFSYCLIRNIHIWKKKNNIFPATLFGHAFKCLPWRLRKCQFLEVSRV